MVQDIYKQLSIVILTSDSTGISGALPINLAFHITSVADGSAEVSMVIEAGSERNQSVPVQSTLVHHVAPPSLLN